MQQLWLTMILASASVVVAQDPDAHLTTSFVESGGATQESNIILWNFDAGGNSGAGDIISVDGDEVCVPIQWTRENGVVYIQRVDQGQTLLGRLFDCVPNGENGTANRNDGSNGGAGSPGIWQRSS